MKSYAVTEQLVNSVLNYLGKQPYVEVAALINALGQVQEVPPVPLAVVPKPEEK
jgi:hypothetical protein